MSILTSLASAWDGSLAVKGTSARAFDWRSDQMINSDDVIVATHPVSRHGQVERSLRAKQHSTRDVPGDNSRLIQRWHRNVDVWGLLLSKVWGQSSQVWATIYVQNETCGFNKIMNWQHASSSISIWPVSDAKTLLAAWVKTKVNNYKRNAEISPRTCLTISVDDIDGAERCHRRFEKDWEASSNVTLLALQQATSNGFGLEWPTNEHASGRANLQLK